MSETNEKTPEGYTCQECEKKVGVIYLKEKKWICQKCFYD